MKVALCLFGIVGGSSGKDGEGESVNPGIAFRAYCDHILSKNDVDVYFHTWSLEHGKELLEMYNPVKYIIEPQVIFSDDPVSHRTQSRWYSTRQSIDLIKGNYDIVMLSRFDVAFFSDVIFDDYDPEYFHASHWNDVGNRKNHTRGFLDLWFFGGQDIMRRFGQLSLYIDKYNISPHKAAKQHLLTITDKIRYTMYRGEDFEMVRRAILNSKK